MPKAQPPDRSQAQEVMTPIVQHCNQRSGERGRHDPEEPAWISSSGTCPGQGLEPVWSCSLGILSQESTRADNVAPHETDHKKPLDSALFHGTGVTAAVHNFGRDLLPQFRSRRLGRIR